MQRKTFTRWVSAMIATAALGASSGLLAGPKWCDPAPTAKKPNPKNICESITNKTAPDKGRTYTRDQTLAPTPGHSRQQERAARQHPHRSKPSQRSPVVKEILKDGSDGK